METHKKVVNIYHPEKDLGSLFHDVQISGLFKDSKTIADAVLLNDPQDIRKEYQIQKDSPSFLLKEFVNQNFDHREHISSADEEVSKKQKNIQKHLKKLWNRLERDPDESSIRSSKLPLPKKYIVPGGRFDEIYYWDSYFTMLGLRSHGKRRRIDKMILNFEHLIKTYGHIPNGNRSYYLSRSQPPFFASMIQLIARGIRRKRMLKKYKDALWQEYRFWMDQSTAQYPAYRRVLLPDGFVLNRYYDQLDEPRPESYKEDIELFHAVGEPPQNLFRNIRAACESGWDFSSRWLANPNDLMSIQTISIIPVDLNSLLYMHEITLSESLEYSGLIEEAELIRESAEQRKQAIIKYLFDPMEGIFLDYDFQEKRLLDRPSMAMAFPLWAGIATTEQANQVILYLEQHFLKPGGLVTTNCESGQQWDSPNGWAPLQWVAVQGALRYGYKSFANEVMKRWCHLNERVYEKTGKMMEKYNVVDLSLEAGGGEYPVQDGFGWTNGVYLSFKDMLKK
jgi:alpha,alpha-trehalase